MQLSHCCVCLDTDLDLTKNPKDIGKDIKRGIQKNTPDLPDLSELPNLTKQPNFFKGEGEVNATNEVKNKVRPQSFKTSAMYVTARTHHLNRPLENVLPGSQVDALSDRLLNCSSSQLRHEAHELSQAGFICRALRACWSLLHS
jgi:hypothetical protein